MDSPLANKQCSITNYIKQVDAKLHNLLDKVFCADRLFRPRRGAPGITFLRPTGTVLTKLEKMGLGDDAMGANEALRSMVLHDFLPTAQAFAERKDEIPTALHRKLPIKEINGDKIILENGATLELDKKFKPREDRANMAVWILTKDLVPTNGEELTASTAAKKIKQKKVKGGAEFQNTKRQLFEAVLADECKRYPLNGSAAMEALCTICDFLKARDQAKYLVVCSQLSWDFLGSLAIILQPYSRFNDYLSPADLQQLSQVASHSSMGLGSIYAYVTNPLQKYEEHMNFAKSKLLEEGECRELFRKFVEKRNEIFEGTIKTMALANIKHALKILEESPELEKYLPARANKLKNNPESAIAEVELRINSHSLICDSTKGIDFNEALRNYRKHNLDKPYFVVSRMMDKLEVTTYRGLVEVFLRCDSLFYLPGLADAENDIPISQLFHFDNDIRVDLDIVQKNSAHLKSHYDRKENSMPDKLKEALAAMHASIVQI
jgi:hypothetical protein